MSLALYNDMKKIREQLLDMLQRIESLEEYRQSQTRPKREILTMPKPETPSVAEWARKNPPKAANVEK